MPPWLVGVLGVALTLGLLAWWFVSNVPPDTDEKARASYQAGFEAGKRLRQQQDAAPAQPPSTDVPAER